ETLGALRRDGRADLVFRPQCRAGRAGVARLRHAACDPARQRFMQNVLRQRAAIEAGNFVEPSGATAASRIDVHDLADVAVAVASRPFAGRALTLPSPAALTGDQMAAKIDAFVELQEAVLDGRAPHLAVVTK